MPTELTSLLVPVLTFAAGAIGSFLLWAFWAIPTLRKEVNAKESQLKKEIPALARKEVADLLENMDAGAIMDRVLKGLDEALPDNPNKPLHPALNKLFARFSVHAANLVNGAIGNMTKKVAAEFGMDLGDLGSGLDSLMDIGGSKGQGEIAGMLKGFAQLGRAFNAAPGKKALPPGNGGW